MLDKSTYLLIVLFSTLLLFGSILIIKNTVINHLVTKVKFNVNSAHLPKITIGKVLFVMGLRLQSKIINLILIWLWAFNVNYAMLSSICLPLIYLLILIPLIELNDINTNYRHDNHFLRSLQANKLLLTVNILFLSMVILPCWHLLDLTSLLKFMLINLSIALLAYLLIHRLHYEGLFQVMYLGYVLLLINHASIIFSN